MDKDRDILKKARRITRVVDLERERGAARFAITEDDGSVRTITLQKRKRQVLETLMQSPIYAASPVRLSDMVHLLKLDDGIDIETVMFPGDPGTGTLRYGIYRLVSQVERLDDFEVAA